MAEADGAAAFGKGSHLHLIDGSGFIFRAYHALPPLTRKSDGMPIGAVAGFSNMVWKMLQETRGADAPTHVAVIFDKSEVTFRNALYPEYKQNRPPAPDDADERTERMPDHDTPERQLSQFEERRRLQLALDELPDEQREVVLLRLEQELSLEEIGEMTGVGRETVKSRLRYAMDKLRQRLNP